MMGDRHMDQGVLFYGFSLDRQVPQDHLLRAIDRFVDLEGIRANEPFWFDSAVKRQMAPLLV